MKKGLNLQLVFALILSLGFVSAAAIADDLHVNVQVRDDSGNILTGTYKFDFNISTTSGCDAVVYNSTTTAATDARGIVSYYLENLDIDFNEQYYLCYYRDGTLKSASKIVRTPYSFNSKYLGGYAETYFLPLNTSAIGTFSKINTNSSTFLDDYDSSYFMPLNTSVTGTFDFNGGWQSGGLTLQEGSIYAQAGYFYNISSLQINRLEVNGSLFPYPGYSNIFDIGNSSLLWNDLWLGGNANISDTLTTKTIKAYDWTNISHIYLYNHTLSTFTAYNSSWDNRYLIADVSTALSNNITSVNNTKNIQEILNSTGIYSPFPSGMVSFFKLSACPTGWTQDPDSVGRYVVGANSSYTINATGGTALTNNENRTVGQHNHGVTDPAHTHNPPEGSSAFLVQQGGVANYAGGGNPVNPGAGLTGPASTGVTINNEGSVAGTNAPYIQYLVCVKD